MGKTATPPRKQYRISVDVDDVEIDVEDVLAKLETHTLVEELVRRKAKLDNAAMDASGIDVDLLGEAALEFAGGRHSDALIYLSRALGRRFDRLADIAATFYSYPERRERRRESATHRPEAP
jgi:hypothetical protein